MTDLLIKLNYKGQERIAVINSTAPFIDQVTSQLKDIVIDRVIDPRYPYSYMILFVKTREEVKQLAPAALHNLTADGILWFCYPKKTSKTYSATVDRDHGWEVLADAGFRGIRLVSIDDDWSAMRFRNIKYIKTSSGNSK